ncbi:hypothetical protein, partial [Escherichia marmotae]|uniref:hypothetical protein n=1 Tax=Escherichia marmotae TaxID=1499973 RepID=UPI002FEF685E
WKGWAIFLRQKQKKFIMLPSETMIWQPEFTDKTLSRKTGAVQSAEIITYNTITKKMTASATPGQRVRSIIYPDKLSQNKK